MTAGRGWERAPAKVNLALHVTGRRPDGYHLLDSLVCFPRVGDRLEAEVAPTLSLTIDGPFGRGLDAGAGNLVLRAARLLDGGDGAGAAGAALRLEKLLPVAAGIGGGSSDAAAALRLLGRLWNRPLPGAERLAALGADVPVCLAAPQPARMQGTGERVDPVRLPHFWIVLVQPGVPLATAEVFARLSARDNPPLPPLPARFSGADDLCGWLAAARNDLEAPAVGIVPGIGRALALVGAQPDCRLARMSGSGATCFGIFAREAAAVAAAAAIRRAEPGYWVEAAPVP